MRTILAAIALAALALPAAGQDATADVPMTKVVLFSSGVGYFERFGSVDGNATMQLSFRTDQINDMLKSMVLMDLDGGAVAGVSYASRDPLTRALKSFAIDLSGDYDMDALLRKLRGAEVTVAAPDKVTGRIYGIETHTKQIMTGSQPTIVTELVIDLLTPEGFKSLPMSAVQNIALTDERLASEINKALDLIASSRDTQRKAVEVSFTGKGKRRVRIGYINETPVWKTSYRLDLSGEKPLIQGWAIVENATDSDWTDVSLSLVSGRPISFIQDLYTPLYVPRPEVRPQLYASLRPQMYEEGMEAPAEAEAKELAKPSVRARRLVGEMAAAAPPRAAGLAMMEEAAKGEIALGGAGVVSLAAAGEVGELFSYTIQQPVTLPRQTSAMLPIINSPIAAEKVSIYNQNVLAKNPLNGAYLTNDTGLKMIAGPVTVLDDGMYAGDAQIDNLTPGEKRLISYAVDLNVTVDPSVKTDSRIVAVKIVRGVMNVRRLHTFSQTYAIRNKSADKRTLIVEHPFNAERKLVAPEKFEEKTPTLYRFRVEVDPNSTKDLLVKEEQVITEGLAILDASVDNLLWYVRHGELSQAARDALTKAIEMRQALAQTQAAIAEKEKQLNEIKQGQDRLRKNIDTVGRDSTIGKRYLAKLNEEENTIEKLEGELAELRATAEQQQKALADYISGLNVE